MIGRRIEKANRLLMFCFLLLTGCASEYPKDVVLVSVTLTNMQDVPNFGTYDDQSYWGYYWTIVESKRKQGEAVKVQDLQVFTENYTPGRNERLLKVGFATKEDLFGDLMSSDRLKYFVSRYICGQQQFTYPLIVGQFFSEKQGLPYFGSFPPAKNSDGLYVYYSFVHVAGASKRPTRTYAFDLQESPNDICLVIRSTNFFGWGIAGGAESNSIVISKELIEKLLNE